MKGSPFYVVGSAIVFNLRSISDLLPGHASQFCYPRGAFAFRDQHLDEMLLKLGVAIVNGHYGRIQL